MRISDIRLESDGDFVELHANVHHETHWVWGDGPFQLFYRYPAEFAGFLSETNGDPFVAAFVIPAMVLGEDLKVDAPVSPRLLWNNRHTIQDILGCWNHKFSRIDITTPIPADPKPNIDPGHRGVFFSMGVDSSYTLLKNVRDHAEDDESFSHLITVEGFDVYLWESERFVPMLRSIREVAAATGKQVLPITTNLRDLTDRIADWPRAHHGAALASTVLALGPSFSRVHISASVSYDHLFPWGTHPLLDPLWSTESLAFVHDGCEARRIDKLRLIAQMNVQAILENLRVCSTDLLTGDYNCGRCEKCIRTMIGLHICGALDRCTVLPHTIDPDLIRTFTVKGPYLKMIFRELADELGTSAADLAIKDALLDAISREVD